jgi:alkylhydroperoxidase/carboxymuconolactone decarboxylase family protein YurZ
MVMVDRELLDEMYAKRGYLFEWQVLLAQEAPEFLRAFDATWTEVNTDSEDGLPGKYRELVYATVASVLGEDAVAKNHMHKALDQGANRAELIDAILVAWTPSGSRTLIHGLRTLVEVLKERGEYEVIDTGHRISDRPNHEGRTFLEDKE